MSKVPKHLIDEEAFADAFYTAYENIHDGTRGIDFIMDRMCEWCWLQVVLASASYGQGYTQGMDDEAYRRSTAGIESQ